MSPRSRPLRALGSALLGSALLGPALGGPAAGQAPGSEGRPSLPPARATFALDPDTVRIGEPFLLGVTVRVEPGWQPRFPEVLPAEAGLEQRAAADVRQTGPEEWRAYYRFVAWATRPGNLPAIDLELEADDERLTAAFRPPAVTVLSVLPEDGSDLELRPARPFLERSGPPWLPILLGALGLLALVAWWLRRRGRAVGERNAVSAPPLERALRELRELRRRLEAGELEGAAFYDRLEGSLRRYAEATRGWPPGTLIRRLPDGNRELAAVLRRSAMTRFGRLGGGEAAGPAALDVCETWLEAERAPGAEGGVVPERTKAAETDGGQTSSVRRAE